MYQAGTLSGNPLAMAAGCATVRYLCDHKEIYAKLDQLAAEVVSGVAAAARNAGVTMCHNRVGSMFTWFFAPGPSRIGPRRPSPTRRPSHDFPGHAGKRNLPAALAV